MTPRRPERRAASPLAQAVGLLLFWSPAIGAGLALDLEDAPMSLLTIVLVTAAVVALLGIYLVNMAVTPDVARAGMFLAALGGVVAAIAGLVWLFP